MNLLFFKLSVTPLLIAGLTLAARRWGPKVGGLLTGLPLASGPILAFLALQHGLAFATSAALGTLSGIASVAAFCLTYVAVAKRQPWPFCALSGAAAFFAFTAVLRWMPLGIVLTTLCTLAVLSGVLFALPQPVPARPGRPAPLWDLPARVGVTTLFVVAITSASAALGPRLSGLLAPFPAFALVLAAFTHAQQGAAASMLFLRGIVLASFASVAFFVVCCLGLVHLGLAPTLVGATVAALLVGGSIYRGDRLRAPAKPATPMP